MYHALSDQKSDTHYTVTLSDFRGQLRQIKDAGRPVLTVDEYCHKPAAGAVIITFDDGHASNLRLAAPALQEHGFKATFFMTTEWIGSRESWLTWPEVSQLAQMDMDLGTHGHTHAFLDRVDPQFLRNELEVPLQQMRDRTGVQAKHLALPGGRFSAGMIKLATELGYRSISTSIPGLNKIKNVNYPLVLSRYPITQGTTSRTFDLMISQDRRYARQTLNTYRLKRFGKRVLGNRLYQKLWATLKA